MTGVGTVAAGGALYAGIKKKDLDAKAEELDKKMQNIENLSDAEFVKFLKEMAKYEELKEQYDSMCQMKHDYQAQSQKLGNVRTGLMVGNTATAVAGTLISSRNKNDSRSIKDKIQICLNTINSLQQKIGQTMFDCVPGQYEKLRKTVSICNSLSTKDMDKVSNRNQISSVVSGINIGTGAAGVITSALANNSQHRNNYDDKTKNLNTAANVFAGTSMVASGVSTIFNASTLSSINSNLSISADCEEALNQL